MNHSSAVDLLGATENAMPLIDMHINAAIEWKIVQKGGILSRGNDLISCNLQKMLRIFTPISNVLKNFLLVHTAYLHASWYFKFTHTQLDCRRIAVSIANA